MPRWAEIALFVLIVGVVLVLPPVVEWVVDGRTDYAVVAVGGALGGGAYLLLRRRRERNRS